MHNAQTKPNIVTLTEEISLVHKMVNTDLDKAFQIDTDGKLMNYFKEGNAGTFTISRSLKDDSMIVLQDMITTSYHNNYPRLSINKVDVYMNQYTNYHTSIDGLSGGNRFLGHLEHASIAQKLNKFKNLESVWAGLRIAGPRSTDSTPYNGDYNHFIYFNHYTNADKVNIYENDHLLVKSIERIDFSSNQTFKPVWKENERKYGSNVPNGTSELNNYKIWYNNTYIVPEPFNQFNGTKTLFKIYTENEDGSGIAQDFSLTKLGTLNIPGMTKNLPLIFKRLNSNEVYRDTNAVHIGDIIIDANTGYNYEKKTIIDDDYESKSEGLLIPYNFKGNYKLNIKEFGLNSAFSGIDITIAKNFKRPILDPEEGLVSLIVNSKDSENTNFKYSIKEQNIKTLKERTPSLRAMINLSDYAKN